MLQARQPAPLPTDADRLNGWKEIASFLGKGVRTAQRWERDFGLPVHRLGANGGEIVFASRAAITQWMQTAAHARARAGTAAEAPGDAAATQVAGASVVADEARVTRVGTSALRRARWLAVAALVALGVAVAYWLGTRARGDRSAPPEPATWRVQDDRLTVLREGGRVLWSRRFDEGLAEASYLGHPGEPGRAAGVRIEDVDGDRSREVLFAVKSDRVPTPSFLLLNADGSVRFTYTAPTDALRFGEATYVADWMVQGSWTTASSDGERSIWVLYYHKPFFPSLLVQLDPHGRVRSQYVSNGYIVHVAETRWRGRDVVMVGAANNETRGGSLAIFEGRTVRGSAPAQDPKYRCTNCPAGGPDTFLTFPRTCLSLAPGDTARVGHAWVGKDDTVWAEVHHGTFKRADTVAGAVVYVFDRDLRPSRAEFGGTYVALHRQELEARQLVDHPVGPRDEATAFPVRIWRGTRFEDLPPAPVATDR